MTIKRKESGVQTVSEPLEITLKNREVLESLNALGALDQCKLPPLVLLATVKLGLALKASSEATLKVRDSLAKRFFKDGKIDPKGANFPEYRDQVEQVLDQTTTFQYTPISSVDLNLEENTIPISVLMALNWLISDLK